MRLTVRLLRPYHNIRDETALHLLSSLKSALHYANFYMWNKRLKHGLLDRRVSRLYSSFF